jgi:hypothetical protein
MGGGVPLGFGAGGLDFAGALTHTSFQFLVER